MLPPGIIAMVLRFAFYREEVRMVRRSYDHRPLVKMKVNETISHFPRYPGGRQQLVRDLSDELLMKVRRWPHRRKILARGNSENYGISSLRRLISCGARVQPTTRGARTALMWVAEKGHLEAVKILMQCKADVNARSETWEFPLMLASREGYPEVVATLLAAGADVGARYHGKTSLEKAVAMTKARRARTPAELAVANGRTAAIQQLINAAGQPQKDKNRGFVPLKEPDANGFVRPGAFSTPSKGHSGRRSNHSPRKPGTRNNQAPRSERSERDPHPPRTPKRIVAKRQVGPIARMKNPVAFFKINDLPSGAGSSPFGKIQGRPVSVETVGKLDKARVYHRSTHRRVPRVDIETDSDSEER